MERFVRGAAIGVAVCGTTFVMIKVNKMVINTMAAVNTAVIRTLLIGVFPPHEVLDEDTMGATAYLGAHTVALTAVSLALTK